MPRIIPETSSMSRIRHTWCVIILCRYRSTHFPLFFPHVYLRLVHHYISGIFLGMGSANARRRYCIMPPFIGRAHTKYDPACTCIATTWLKYYSMAKFVPNLGVPDAHCPPVVWWLYNHKIHAGKDMGTHVFSITQTSRWVIVTNHCVIHCDDYTIIRFMLVKIWAPMYSA